MLIVKPQIHQGIANFGIFDGENFVAYASTRLKGHLAAIEITKTLRKPPAPRPQQIYGMRWHTHYVRPGTSRAQFRRFVWGVLRGTLGKLSQ